MSRVSTHHDPVDRFTTGTVGIPGERTFFIQIRGSAGLSSVVVEKSQVQALTERLRSLLRELRSSQLASFDELSVNHLKDNEPLDFPITEDFRVGVIALSWDESIQRISIQLQAIGDEQIVDLLDDEEALQIEDAPELITAVLRLHQARVFIDRADAIVSAGRLDCPFCALPVNSDGHLCPRANGYRR